jgi:uncharacterized protein
MGASMMVRWEGWEGRSLEHLALQEEADGITAESVILGRAGGQPFAASYRISCDSGWRTREVAIGLIGSPRQLLLTADGEGRWRAGAGADLPALHGAVDVDITATPFTNTLPIRRLGLSAGAAADITTVYITVPDLTITTDPQRYTCLEPNRSYIYESRDSDFRRQIETDERGLVLTYPGLFRRVP